MTVETGKNRVTRRSHARLPSRQYEMSVPDKTRDCRVVVRPPKEPFPRERHHDGANCDRSMTISSKSARSFGVLKICGSSGQAADRRLRIAHLGTWWGARALFCQPSGILSRSLNRRFCGVRGWFLPLGAIRRRVLHQFALKVSTVSLCSL